MRGISGWFALLGAMATGLHAGCEPSSTSAPSPANKATKAAAAIVPEPARKEPKATCDAPIAVYEAGRRVDSTCPEELARSGLTVIDLSDDWAPKLLADPPDENHYRPTYVALANERFGKGPEWDRAREDRYLELYGVFPSIRVVRDRLGDEARHRCHDEVDDTPLEKLDHEVDLWRDLTAQRSDKGVANTLHQKLEAERKRRKLDGIDGLANDRYFGTSWQRYQRLGGTVQAIIATQGHLRCDGMLSKRAEKGVFDMSSTIALKTYQRKHMIVSWTFDDRTRKALTSDSRELDYLSLLRALRERVVDAAGLIEDGTASGEHGLVVGRSLDEDTFKAVGHGNPMENGAPDAISKATDAAARALGWTSPRAALEALEALGRDGTQHVRVAVRLPALPAYYSANMELRVEIDRGDVWYEFPYNGRGERISQPVERRPTVVLYAKDGGRDVALMRWPTTVGGWKFERLGPHDIGMVYKDSPVGSRVWRDIIATPVWIPPESAPKRELVRPRVDGSWATKQDLFGPGYASAYGMVMLVHHRASKVFAGESQFHDEGIRTHGSVSYDSIHHGSSHGCHRLFNHMAVRLSSFLLAHRHVVEHGADDLGYGRSFNWQGKAMKLTFESRGYRYELDPPIPVEVLRGRVMGRQTTPPTGSRPLPERFLKLFTQDRFEQ